MEPAAAAHCMQPCAAVAYNDYAVDANVPLVIEFAQRDE